MGSSLSFFAGLAALAVLAPGAAQAQTTGDVTVNPGAAFGGRYLLLYPGGEAMRIVPVLLQPGQKSGPIHLHMPTRHRARRTEPSPAPQTARAEAPKAAPRTVAKPAAKQASAAPPASSRPSTGYVSSFGGPGSVFGGPVMTMHPTNPAPAAGEKQSSAAPPVKLAKAEPAPESTLPGLTRRSVILFAKGAAAPMDSALDQIRFLAGDLNAAMTRPASRIELQAYGGARGDKGSDARRLSLKRALAIRQVLITDGVDAGRIDVRAMGGAQSGPADRVDIYVKA